MTKVIHVHLIQRHKSYYFGSIPAIYSTLTVDEIGIRQSSLERVGRKHPIFADFHTNK